VAAEPRGAKIKKRLAIDPVEAEVLRLMFRLFREQDGKSGSMGVKAVTICPLCHTRALVPTFVLEWRKFGAPDRIRTCGLCLRREANAAASDGTGTACGWRFLVFVHRAYRVVAR
jgi:hypothetical protein